MIRRRTIRINQRRRLSRAISIDGYARLALPFSALLIAACLFSYVGLTSLTVWNTAKRSSFEKEIAIKESKVAEIEEKLSMLQGSITEAMAYNKGFGSSAHIKYISAKPLTQATRIDEVEL